MTGSKVEAGAKETALHGWLNGQSARLGAQLLEAREDVRRLRAQLTAARYVFGPHGCADPEDRDCPEYLDEQGHDRPEVEWCSHVEWKTATFADVKAREFLEAEILELRKLARQGCLPETAAALAEDIDGWLETLRQILDDIPPEMGGGRQAFSVADLKAAAAELDAATQRWHEREGAEFAKRAADDLFDAREENKRLTVLLRHRDAELARLKQTPAGRDRATNPCTRCGATIPAGRLVCETPCLPATVGGER